MEQLLEIVIETDVFLKVIYIVLAEYLIILCLYIATTIYLMVKYVGFNLCHRCTLIVTSLLLAYTLNCIYLILLAHHEQKALSAKIVHIAFTLLYQTAIAAYVYNNLRKCRFTLVQNRKVGMYNAFYGLYVSALVLLAMKLIFETLDAYDIVAFGSAEILGTLVYMDYFVVLLFITLIKKWYKERHYNKYAGTYFAMLASVLLICFLNIAAIIIFYVFKNKSGLPAENHPYNAITIEVVLDFFDEIFPLIGLKLFIFSAKEKTQQNDTLLNESHIVAK